MSRPPRVLLLALRDDWLGPPRAAEQFAKAGLDVAALCPDHGPVAVVGSLRQRYAFSGTNLGPDLIVRAVTEWQPDRVLPMDDAAVQWLHALAQHPSALPEPVARSLATAGNAALLASFLNKRAGNQAARSAGLNVPKGIRIEPGGSLPSALPPLPLILKPVTGYAGTGMTVVHDARELSAVTPKPYVQLLQQFVRGETWAFPFLAERGALVSGFAARKVHMHPPLVGPSSQIEIREHSGLRDAAARLVAATGYHGFGSLDVQVDAQDRAWFLECNPRPPPFLHLGARAGPDPIAALADILHGRAPAPRPLARERWLVALWPQEKARDPQGRDTGAAEWDMPEDPALRAWISQRQGYAG